MRHIWQRHRHGTLLMKLSFISHTFVFQTSMKRNFQFCPYMGFSVLKKGQLTLLMLQSLNYLWFSLKSWLNIFSVPQMCKQWTPWRWDQAALTIESPLSLDISWLCVIWQGWSKHNYFEFSGKTWNALLGYLIMPSMHHNGNVTHNTF